MTSTSMHTTSIWMETGALPDYAPLGEDTRADVCVIGAGIAGISTAYMLLLAGKSVIVVDSGNVGCGQTARTTAHLSNALDDRYFEIERMHGEKGARLAAESHTAAISRIEAIVAKEAIDCDFERLDGYLFVPPHESRNVLDKERVAARHAGLVDVEYVDRAPLASFDTGRCLCFPGQAQFHPLKYLAGLAEAITRMSGRIFTGTHVDQIEENYPARITTNSGQVITADALVVATNVPINDRFTMHTKQAPYRSYVIAARVPSGSVTKALYWDTLDPYHYVRVQTAPHNGDYDLLIVGGEDHKTGQADDGDERLTRLEDWTRERFPMIEMIEHRWSGQVIEPVDGMAFIGVNPLSSKNIYIVTSDSGNGMTHGTIAGMLLTDLIMGRKNDWATLYDPARVTLHAATDFVRENLNVAARYADWLKRDEVASVDKITPGSGAVIRRGLKKVAIYRDEGGILHERSAVCPHLGCIVAWNSTENTWDCPCHGSRFEADGQVINGPSKAGLGDAERK